MNENVTDVTTDDYKVAMGNDDLTIEHPERKQDDELEDKQPIQPNEEVQDDETSSMTWAFVFGMIFLALLLSMNVWVLIIDGSEKEPNGDLTGLPAHYILQIWVDEKSA